MNGRDGNNMSLEFKPNMVQSLYLDLAFGLRLASSTNSWLVLLVYVCLWSIILKNVELNKEVEKKNKETYLEAMEEYKRTKEEEAISQKKEEDELMKLHKQEAPELLKKKEKTGNLIIKKKKETHKKKNKNVNPNKPKKLASSFFLFRKALTDERPGTRLGNHCSNLVKWKHKDVLTVGTYFRPIGTSTNRRLILSSLPSKAFDIITVAPPPPPPPHVAAPPPADDQASMIQNAKNIG
ncbi:hypothetical protein F2Q69_00053762 [Brassica cretica]|uniref:Uncharacterized protein n=1 Tax=Brassica cretica TaxID=69181 RepID=A0A8S9N202_BRACR|nr:hypothetical protein F2Q69_00053762 [Brassica cretica]